MPQFFELSPLTEVNYPDYYARSINEPEDFWKEQAEKYINWFEPAEKILSGGFDLLDVNWFQGGKLNASYNCLDRHLKTHADYPAIIWEGNQPNQTRILSYQELFEKVCRFANALKRLHIKKGDRVCIYLPMIPEVAIAMLACTRIGAIHSVVFGGFSAEALRDRILDADCHLVITANEGLRADKIIPFKVFVDQALSECPQVQKVVVVKHTENEVPWNPSRDFWYDNLLLEAEAECPAQIMDAQDPLFILYTSGSTGKPKGILHGTGGYLVYVAMTFKIIFNYVMGEVYWCTADVGWITGHSYGIYGPLLNGATTLLFEGIPNYPTPSRYWEIIDKYKVNIFYTSPTALRALRREGNQWVSKTKRDSLRILGTVGEPINSEVWKWFNEIIGNHRCPIVDTWWQTETGGIMISSIPGITPFKPGSAAWPFFGVVPKIINDAGEEVSEGTMGKLVITQPWPGLMQTVYGSRERFVDTYFKEFPGYYFTGDQAYCDTEGCFWILGRSDDVIKVSGHRIGTQEVESALALHPDVSEAAVVAIPDEVKGQSIYAFVTVKKGVAPSQALNKELITLVRERIGPIATPQYIQWSEGLPKTRSGKIMRRLLRKIANGEVDDLGDLSTLAEPNGVTNLIKGCLKNKT